MNTKTILTTNWFNHNWLFNDNCNLSAETLFLFVATVEEHQTDREKNQHAHIQLLLCVMECWLSTLDTLFRSENKNEAKNLCNVFVNHQLMKRRQQQKKHGLNFFDAVILCQLQLKFSQIEMELMASDLTEESSAYFMTLISQNTNNRTTR